MEKNRRIKKYKNRRLYDLEISKYITVDDLQRYVMDGLLFDVEDAASGKDITNATLLQIFVEMEAQPTQFLSTGMLRQLIMMAHHPMNRVCQSMLEDMMGMMEHQISETIHSSNYHKAMGSWNEHTQQLLSQWTAIFRR